MIDVKNAKSAIEKWLLTDKVAQCENLGEVYSLLEGQSMSIALLSQYFVTYCELTPQEIVDDFTTHSSLPRFLFNGLEYKPYSLTIPANIYEIGPYCFEDSPLEKCFYSGDALSKNPAGGTFIGDGAFNGCPLKEINFQLIDLIYDRRITPENNGINSSKLLVNFNKDYDGTFDFSNQRVMYDLTDYISRVFKVPMVNLERL